MKIIVLFYLSITCWINLYSQTYISFLAGLDFSKISNYDSISVQETNLLLLENGFSVESPVLGLRLKKLLTKEIFLAVTSDYTYKKVKATNLSGIAQYEAISFNYFRNNIAVYCKLNKYSIGIAGCYNFINSLNYVYVNGAKDKINTATHESGMKIIGGYEYKKFEMNLYYYRGLNSVTDDRNKLHWKPIESIGLMIFYNLQL